MISAAGNDIAGSSLIRNQCTVLHLLFPLDIPQEKQFLLLVELLHLWLQMLSQLQRMAFRFSQLRSS